MRFAVEVTMPTTMSDADRKMLADLFQLLDVNNDGFISMNELYDNVSKQTAETWMDSMDFNKDGKISKQEWLQAWGAAWNETVKDSMQELLRDITWKRKFGMSPTLMLGVVGIVAALAFAMCVKARA